MKVLDCVTGRYSLVDDEDHRHWRGYRWGQDNHGYICADFQVKGKKPRRFYLHRLISKPEPGQQVHHKNRCPWDNRRENLENLSVEEHLKRHPNSKNLQNLVQAREIARRQWIDDQVLLSRIREAEKLGVL